RCWCSPCPAVVLRVPGLRPRVSSRSGRSSRIVRGGGRGLRGCAAHGRAAFVTPDLSEAGRSALTLLVARVLADHHDTAVSTDDLALLADRLDAGLHLHSCSFFHREGPGLTRGCACEIVEAIFCLLVPVDDASA